MVSRKTTFQIIVIICIISFLGLQTVQFVFEPELVAIDDLKTNLQIVSNVTKPEIRSEPVKNITLPIKPKIPNLRGRDISTISKDACPNMKLEECLGGGKFGSVLRATCRPANAPSFQAAVKFGKFWHVPEDKTKDKAATANAPKEVLLWNSGPRSVDVELSVILKAPESRNIYKLHGLTYISIPDLITFQALHNHTTSDQKKIAKCLDPKAIELLLDTEDTSKYLLTHDNTVKALVLEYTGEPAFWSVLRAHVLVNRKWEIGRPHEVETKYPKYYHHFYDVMLGIAEGLSAIHSVSIAHKDLDVSGKNILLKEDDKGVTAYLMDLGVSEQCLSGAYWKLIQKIEMYEFANTLYLSCYRRDVFLDGGEVHHPNLKCSQSKVTSDAMQTLRQHHAANHVGALLDSVVGNGDKAGARFHINPDGSGVHVTSQCRQDVLMDELMYDIWQPVLNETLPIYPWDKVIQRLTALRDIDPEYFKPQNTLAIGAGISNSHRRRLR
eukprot:TRINITY_DN7971_c0_g1::TRINITY_DN7971_c0_g1_i1::g.15556::m.15556 TRINITY_DN7971_c0_g1::TRINITY_DN7971_c0_g1_i1::g.15556  ORF type:complete len:497 (-),score=69.12,Pkinase/PF00069.20/1.9e-07,Pkinase_Tyr/PF07714.12/0.37,Pkinase_Tyr/PF07714.12/0.0013,Kdo/PF06293.9/0.085 TRINITY_DN7971_c0_g1_i1:216-1706(-)